MAKKIGRKNIWYGYRPVMRATEDRMRLPKKYKGAALLFLECAGKPMRLWTCRDLHPCGRCRGTGCTVCQNTGVGPIPGDPEVTIAYCECCSRTSIDDDPELIVHPDERPAPEPKAASKPTKAKPAKNKPKKAGSVR